MNRLLPGWEPLFYQQSPIFSPIEKWAANFSDCDEWPELAKYQALLERLPEPISTLNGVPLKIVEQDVKPTSFEEHYAPRIYYTGEIQTRRNNWHDYFQFLTWFIFPKTKAVINAIHIPQAKERITQGGELGRRSPIENMLSLFDEGGCVLVASDSTLLDHVREFDWKTLFWERRGELEGQFHCITFGHAMYEKALAPYIGMTANSILLEVEPAYFSWRSEQQLAWIDERLAEMLLAGDTYSKPKDLSPFPILGMPGWDAANAEEGYYDNRRYFRPGRGG